MKAFLIAFLFSPIALAQLPQAPKEVKIIKVKDELTYSNFLTISKEFEGARDNQSRIEREQECQEWIMGQIMKKEAPTFKAYCLLKTDVILREYVLTGKVLLKSW